MLNEYGEEITMDSLKCWFCSKTFEKKADGSIDVFIMEKMGIFKLPLHEDCAKKLAPELHEQMKKGLNPVW